MRLIQVSNEGLRAQHCTALHCTALHTNYGVCVSVCVCVCCTVVSAPCRSDGRGVCSVYVCDHHSCASVALPPLTMRRMHWRVRGACSMCVCVCVCVRVCVRCLITAHSVMAVRNKLIWHGMYAVAIIVATHENGNNAFTDQDVSTHSLVVRACTYMLVCKHACVCVCLCYGCCL
jgi:hypothetical protein